MTLWDKLKMLIYSVVMPQWKRKIDEVQVPRYIQSIMQAKDENCNYLSKFY